MLPSRKNTGSANISSGIRCTFIIDHFRTDGAQKHFYDLMLNLDREKINPSLIVLNASFSKQWIDTLQQAGIDVEVIGKAKLMGGIGLLQLIGIVRRQRPEVVVSCLLFADITCRFLKLIKIVPKLVCAVRAVNLDYSGPTSAVLRVTSPLVDAFVFNSTAALKYCRNTERVAEQRCVIIRNGIKIDYSNNEAISDVPELNNDKTWKLGTLGRLEPQKSYDTLIKALSLLPHRNWLLLMAGEGGLKEDLENLASHYGLSKQVRFLGRHLQPLEYLRELDLFLHPSLFEGMPNAVLEAFSLARPCILSDIPEHREFAEHGRDCMMVTTQEPQCWAKAIQRFIEEPEEFRSLGRRARDTAQEFSIERMTASWERVIRSMVY